MAYEEDMEIDLEGTEGKPAEEEPFIFDEDSPNLVAAFEGHPDGMKALEKISAYVIEKTDEAEKSTAPYRDRLAEDNKLLAGDLEPKTFPYKDCANMNIPLMRENLNRIHARMYSEIFGDWTNVVGVVTVGPEDDEKANLISLHDNWQMRNDIPDFPRQMDRGLMMFLNHGDITGHTYRDTVRNENRHEILTPDDFYTPYQLTSTMPDYSDCPFYVKVLKHERHTLQRLKGELSHVDDVLDRMPAYDDEPAQPIAEELNETTGLEQPDATSYHAPYKLFQYEGWCHLLPGQTQDRFIQVVVDPFTQHVLKLSIHEEVSWKDRARERMMQEELDQYHAAVQQSHEARLQRDEASAAMSQALGGEEPGMELAQQMGQANSIVIPDPVKPDWVDGEFAPLTAPKMAKTPIRMFSHAVNQEPMSGGLGVGYGREQADFQRAANTMFSQTVDAATAANAPAGLTSMELGELEYKPGHFTKVDATTEEIAKGIMFVPQPPPNPMLMDGVRLAQDLSSSAAQAPEVLSGEPGKSGETFRGLNSRIEQATKQMTVTARKYSMFMRQLYINNAKLNSMFLEEVAVKRLFDPATKGYVDHNVMREWYERDYDIEIRADLKFTPEAQKKTEAMERQMMLQQNPLLMQNMRLQYEATRDVLIAMGKEEWVQHLGPPPQAQTTPMAPPPPPPEEGGGLPPAQ